MGVANSVLEKNAWARPRRHGHAPEGRTPKRRVSPRAPAHPRLKALRSAQRRLGMPKGPREALPAHGHEPPSEVPISICLACGSDSES
ncbi:hypothetical protein SISSUDRAFT_1046935 [Sistotremastrum suecicum HHB10207 ss-3]|uniref:Uncharacterized protein n=1 Tax=Sistotremastrum suecicum HHB10207 ss-3 TaxID=1314776 RepID=A0A166DGK0_9AGAM|nr:hypothetical protein SISSUDRAFT_1046935 [Sistotremastrum suecicum HHB10207 ss-3]